MQTEPKRHPKYARTPFLAVLAAMAFLVLLFTPRVHAAEPASAERSAPKIQHSVSWKERLRDAGTTGVLQLGLSLFGGAYVFERLLNLRRSKVVPVGLSDYARKLWREGRYGDLEDLGLQRPSTLARAISFVVKNRRSSIADVSELCGELVSREIAVHAQRAYPLGIVASLGPLLGLLGMILGMIETFEIVSMAGSLGDPTQLASGISEALVTTGLGLAIAIPFLSLYHVFKYRTSNFGLMLEVEMTDLINEWLLKSEEAPRVTRRAAEHLVEAHP